MNSATATREKSPGGAAAFAEARELQWTWKPGAMSDMAAAICRLAIARGIAGTFSANDLPTHHAEGHGGRGIAGSVFCRLAKDDVITPVGVFIGTSFQQRFEKNAGGNRVGVWRLKSLARADRLLELHAAQPKPVVITQPDLSPTS